MDKQATKKLSHVQVSTPTKSETEKQTTTEINKTNLGKRKKYEPSEPNSEDLDSVILSESRKKIQKVSHSNTIDGESTESEVEKMQSEMVEVSFVQTKKACVSGNLHTITLSNDGTAYFFGRNNDRGLGLGHNDANNMGACCGGNHTITLSNDGTLHSFGNNSLGQLGLGHNKNISLPTPIPNLPKINQISCGGHFTVCVDHEGYIWSFGQNDHGQLGTGNKTNFNVPEKLQNIPPVISVSCGFKHTLIITNDDNLWSWGRNENGQLCHGDKEDRSNPRQISISNILKISAGCDYSLFQNNKGEIFSCGNNAYGQCGLGHYNDPHQITPSLILNLPSNIIQFVCGYHQSLFLDSEGNVYSVGYNYYGSLGLGHNTNQNVLTKIPNIPPIKTLSCVGSSCYLIDFEGNLWTFGKNELGQLGHGDTTNINTPKVINSVKNIQQISYGRCCGFHFFAKNSQNQIFIAGNNIFGQLGTGDTRSYSIPKEINSQYSTIWRDEFYARAKSARK